MSAHADNPIEQLTHDHEHLSDLVQALGGVLARLEARQCVFADVVDEIEDGVESLREALLLHFAREEEGVFPFVEKHVPALAPVVAVLLADHDAVIKGAAGLGLHLKTPEGPATFAAGYASFVAIYAAHAKAEHAFLHDVETKLDAALREELRVLLKEI